LPPVKHTHRAFSLILPFGIELSSFYPTCGHALSFPNPHRGFPYIDLSRPLKGLCPVFRPSLGSRRAVRAWRPVCDLRNVRFGTCPLFFFTSFRAVAPAKALPCSPLNIWWQLIKTRRFCKRCLQITAFPPYLPFFLRPDVFL